VAPDSVPTSGDAPESALPASELAAWQALQAQHVDHPEACLHLARDARVRGRPDQAARYLNLGLAGAHRQGLRTGATPLYVELALQCRLRGDAALALHHARGAQSVCGEHPDLLREECKALRLLARTRELALRLNRLAALAPGDAAVLVALGEALLQTTSAPQAIKPLRAAFALGYRDDEVALMLAGIELHSGEVDAAERRLRDILSTSPGHLGAQGKLWQLLREQCQWDEAQQYEQVMLNAIRRGQVHASLTPFMLLDSEIDGRTLRAYAEGSTRAMFATPAAV
jgi:Flp pilus assembly protein TadD